MMKHEGSCHCGRIGYEVSGEIPQVVDCNCSFCRRRGALLWFVPAADFKLRTPQANVATYTFNKHRLQHHFCTSCGIAPYSEGTGPDGKAMVAINVRCLPEVDLEALKVVQYDGASK
jgi:hypothetical protein